MRLTKNLLLAFFVMSMLFPSFLAAQGEKLDPAFVTAREARDRAIREGDVDVYDRYTTQDFEVTQPDGKTRTLADQNPRIAAAKTHPAQGPAPIREDEKIDVYPSTVVLNWHQKVQGKNAVFTEVWVKDNGTWKVATAHASFIPTQQ